MSKNKKKLRYGGLFTFIQFLASLAFLGIIMYVDVLPINYLIALGGVLLVFLLITLLTQFNRNISKFNQMIGKVFSVFISVALILGSFYGATAINTLFGISGVEVKTDAISVIVLKDSPYTNLKKLSKELFGVQESVDRDNTDYAIEQVDSKLKGEINVVEFNDYTSQVQALYDGEVQAIVLNESFRKLVEEVSPTFTQDTTIVYQVERKTEIFGNEIDTNVTEESFNIFISGMDEYGDINQTARADVNMVATINPKTKQILLTSIPRDYFVPLPCTFGNMDKLTHAGIYGVDCSVAAVEELLDIEIDYYIKLNFSSIIDVVDAIGGIDVLSEIAFTAVDHWMPDGSKYPPTVIVEGWNHLNGQQALTFVRERYNLPNGDYDRAKNQQIALGAILDKVLSPSLIVNYQSLMKVVTNTVETSLPNKAITSLVKMQIKEMNGWGIQTYVLNGYAGLEYTASIPDIPLYVTFQDPISIEKATTYIYAIENGEAIEIIQDGVEE